MTAQIPLSGRTGQGQCALVDDDDFAAASVYTWYMTRHGYIATGKTALLLHRLIIGEPPSGLVVDHIDGNRLNNQRANLRFATKAENAQNSSPRQNASSQFKGVCWRKDCQLWYARISVNKTEIYLGRFTLERDAARAYNVAAVQYHGEFAHLNIIPADPDEPIRYRQARPRINNSKSKYIGVCWQSEHQQWHSQIRIAGQKSHLGYFDTEQEAAIAYDAAAKLHRGERARLNFPDSTD